MNPGGTYTLGAFALPGFIDTHMHVESSMVTPAEYSRAMVPRGVTTALWDPHELANVHGIKGVEHACHSAAASPLRLNWISSWAGSHLIWCSRHCSVPHWFAMQARASVMWGLLTCLTNVCLKAVYWQAQQRILSNLRGMCCARGLLIF